jgi:outer membrane lipoprotein SlyB
MRHGSIMTALVLSLALAGCKTDEFADNAHLAREASQAVFNVVCALPSDHVIRVRIRDAVSGATGLDTSRVCEQGLGSLLERREAAFVDGPAWPN